MYHLDESYQSNGCRIRAELFSEIHVIMRQETQDGLLKSKHKDSSQCEAFFSCVRVRLISAYLFEEIKIREHAPRMTCVGVIVVASKSFSKLRFFRIFPSRGASGRLHQQTFYAQHLVRVYNRLHDGGHKFLQADSGRCR